MKIEASCVAALVFAAASSTALAADPAANGAMTFPNVRTVNAPQATSTPPAASQSGMRVFKDSVTGLMRKPTAEELNAAAAEPRAASATGQQFVTARGSVGVALDESFLQYAVISRRADGSFAEACVPGATNAEALLKDTSWAELSKGDAHDR